jgi:hypothetical protein
MNYTPFEKESPLSFSSDFHDLPAVSSWLDDVLQRFLCLASLSLRISAVLTFFGTWRAAGEGGKTIPNASVEKAEARVSIRRQSHQSCLLRPL